MFVFLNYKKFHIYKRFQVTAFSSNSATIWDTVLLAQSMQLALFQNKEN